MKLKTKNGELVSGHAKCADLLNKEALELMSSEVDLDERAQRELLEQVDKVFTDQDNQMLDKPITNEEVWESLLRANRARPQEVTASPTQSTSTAGPYLALIYVM